jgi:hypothetical protein
MWTGDVGLRSLIVRQLSGLHRTAVLGIAIGSIYGFAARLIAESQQFSGTFALMTISFLFLVPLGIGYLTVYPAQKPGWAYRVFAPWIPCGLGIFAAWAIGLEGAICIYMSSPLLLLLASVGGVVAGAHGSRRIGHAAAVAVIPFAMAPLEQSIPRPTQVEQNPTEIVVDAPADVVWRHVVEVPTIEEHEQREALYTRLGFPRPISADLSGHGVGGIRHARFEGGVLFIETITAWEAGKRIAFTIAAQTDSIPPTTLDPHVIIGGEYFDVLSGEYVLHPLKDGRTRIELTSSHRLSTRFNPYAGFWAGLVMRSIQNNILEIIRDRAETDAVRMRPE